MKLVRGAYHPHELAAHPATATGADKSAVPQSKGFGGEGYSPSISPDPVPPVWTEKTDTDARYNACVRTLVAAVRADVESEASKEKSETQKNPPTIGVLFGTHNWESADLIVDELARQGLARAEGGGAVVVGDDVAERVTMGQLFGAFRDFMGRLAD